MMTLSNNILIHRQMQNTVLPTHSTKEPEREVMSQDGDTSSASPDPPKVSGYSHIMNNALFPLHICNYVLCVL